MNYKHLYYFWQVANSGHLTHTAEKLHISQSALSSQIKQLEQWLGNELFERRGRQLILTRAGMIAKEHAERIFAEGDNLISQLKEGTSQQPSVIRIGHASTMSRNFVEAFISELVTQHHVHYRLHSMTPDQLFNELADHQIDIGLANTNVHGANQQAWQSRLLARQPVSIIGLPGYHLDDLDDDALKNQHWVLPPDNLPVRAAFNMLSAEHNWQPIVLAEADDMAMLRLLVRDTGALAVIPDVVVKDELQGGQLIRYLELPGVHEHFYAITSNRPFQHPMVPKLLQRFS